MCNFVESVMIVRLYKCCDKKKKQDSKIFQIRKFVIYRRLKKETRNSDRNSIKHPPQYATIFYYILYNFVIP